jgi:hypothetical protein
MTDKGDTLTVGQIADILQEPPQRVAYIITKYRIKAIKRVGIIRLFGPRQVSAIKQGLYTIQVRGQQ